MATKSTSTMSSKTWQFAALNASFALIVITYAIRHLPDFSALLS